MEPDTTRNIEDLSPEFDGSSEVPDNIPIPYQTIVVQDPNVAVNPSLSGLTYTDYSGGLARFLDTGKQTPFDGPWGAKCLPENPLPITPAQHGQAI